MKTCVILILCGLAVALGCTSDKKTSNTKSSTSSKNASSKTRTNSPKEAKPIPAKHIKEAKALFASTSEDLIESIDGKKVFKANCAICHGFKGNMNLNGAKDLTKSKINLENAVAQVYFGRGLMQPYKGILSDAEIISVSRYTETLRK